MLIPFKSPHTVLKNIVGDALYLAHSCNVANNVSARQNAAQPDTNLVEINVGRQKGYSRLAAHIASLGYFTFGPDNELLKPIHMTARIALADQTSLGKHWLTSVLPLECPQASQLTEAKERLLRLRADMDNREQLRACRYDEELLVIDDSFASLTNQRWSTKDYVIKNWDLIVDCFPNLKMVLVLH